MAFAFSVLAHAVASPKTLMSARPPMMATIELRSEARVCLVMPAS
jgi:hypothetical protein